MTKRERAIIMAYTGEVMFTKNDIQYFLDYVKEKTGIEPEVLGWNSMGVPSIYFGPDTDEAKEKIQKACKKDFDNLIMDSENETGYWIKSVVNRQHKIKCSKCGYSESEYASHIRNYCPKCGIKMNEEEN